MDDTKKKHFQNVKDRLLDYFPDLKSAVNDELDWWKDEFPGLHNFVGNVFNPLVKDSLYSLQNQDQLKNIFRFIEELVTSEDEYISEVGEATVCEGIIFAGPEYYHKALLYALPETKERLEGLYKFFYIDKKDEKY